LKTVRPGSLAALLGLGACGERLVDPPVVFDEHDAGLVADDTTLVAGLFREQLFLPLHDGDPLPIVFGTQGGTWVMPGVRAQGFEIECMWNGSLTTETGEVVGTIDRVRVRLNRAPDGWLEVTALPIPVIHAAPREQEPVADLYGVGATLQLTLQDGAGTTLTVALDLALTRG
jgi:hypothetical protein